MNNLLNPAQQRHLRTVLRLFEEDLLTAQSWIEGQQQEGALIHRSLELSPEMRTTARQYIDQACIELKELVSALELEKLDESAAMLLAGQMNEDWADLIDCQSSKLKNYGKVNPEVAELLDPPLSRLISLAYQMAILFERASTDHLKL